MKTKILLCLFLVATLALRATKLPGEPDYTKLWKAVDSLVNKGLTKTALETVDKIYKLAKNDNDAGQFVKAVIYKMKLQDLYQEESYVLIINQLNSEIETAAFPVKPVLHSILAEMYWRYYQGNRYKFMNRSVTVNFKQDDIRTWDLQKITEQTIKHYLASLEDEQRLTATPVNVYDEIIVKQATSAKFRPTLFDFLAHRAVDFFMGEEPALTRPAYKFEIDDVAFFGDAETFSRLPLVTKDSISLKFYALKLLQRLTAYHLSDADPTALIDVELKRLRFIKNSATLELKDSLYLDALEKLEKKHIGSPASADVSYEIASVHYGLGTAYDPLRGDDNKWELKNTIALCTQIMERYPDTYGAKNAAYLTERIKTPFIQLTTEEVNQPEKPFRALIEYANMDKAYVKIIKYSHEDYKKLTRNYYGEKLLARLVKLTPQKEFSTVLVNDADYQHHSLEMKMPELTAGFYLLLASNDKNFDYNKATVAYYTTWVSKISYISRKTDKDGYDFYLFNRETGQPLKNAGAQSFYEKYNYVTRDYDFVKGRYFTTNEDGSFHIPEIISKTYYSRYFYFDFSHQGDHLVTDNEFYQYNYQATEKRKTYKTFFFTDRGIYRPGQTIYFKGVMLSYYDGKYEIAPDMSTTVYLYDVNYQKAGELSLKTNEYGTFSGTFTAPSSGLTGQMRITNSYGEIYFSVEEYKRPKFEVTFEPVKGSYKLNETVNVKGLAKAYAGSNIDGADVKYRVTRTAMYPYWFYWWYGYTPKTPAMEIANGLIKTDENGAYTISFKALPDLSINKKNKPCFNYTVYADVTDINGETHSAQKSVIVGYTALNAKVDIPESVNRQEPAEYRIVTTNLSGEKEPAKGTIAIYKLKQPEKIFRSRMWKRPDKFILSREEYYNAFPFDVFDNENNMYTWEKGDKVFETVFDTERDSVLKPAQMAAWEQGTYLLELKTKDVYNEEVEAYAYFKVYALNEKTIPDFSTDWFSIINADGEPGDTASFVIGSRDSAVYVLYEIERKNKITEKQWLILNNEQKVVKIPISESDRGNFSVHFTFVKHNVCYSHEATVEVPYTNKQLDISFETFRDKLTPGQQEEWRVKVKGPGGDKVAAEMIAAMYDASLDAFKPNNWFFDIYSSYYANLNWETSGMFGMATSTSFTNNRPKEYMYNKYYDYLNWFGFYFRGYNYYYDYYDSYDDAEYDQVMVMSEVTTRESGGHGRFKACKAKGDSNIAYGAGMAAGGDATVLEDAKAAPPPPEQPVTATGTFRGGKDGKELNEVHTRSNFAETAFFFPQLQTDEEGNVIIKFTIPESLTKWKFMGFAHTKDLKFGQIKKDVVTQKELMVIPNAPRFLREGDKITFSAKVSNISDKDLSGQAQLKLFDALTMKPVDSLLRNLNTLLGFEVKKGQSASLSWDIEIPQGIQAITYKIVARAGDFSDGEEMALPVLTNRMLVTETMPLPIRGKQSKTFNFDKLINSGSSNTLRSQKLTLEFTSNPAWYAIQALPYLMEYPYECSEQIFSRFYANSIASHIANSSPRIKAVFDSWRNITPDALLSNLEKNQELKGLILEETPWVLDAKDESQRKKRVALLFDLNRMANELDAALNKLIKAQSPNGGFPWFKGMPDCRYITQHIVTGFGHLDHLGVKNVRSGRTWNMVYSAVKYLDNRIDEDYDYIKKWYPNDMDKNHLGYEQIQYLYARSYFKDVDMAARNKEAFEYFKGQAKKYWLDYNRYLQGMIALALHRYEEQTTALGIIRSLKENALNNDEMGMYWKDMSGGWYWYQAPIETQALLIEAFDEVAGDKVAVEDMKVWLLKQKQTQDWKTTKATVEACYALLLRGADVLASDQLVEINMGGQIIDPKKLDGVKVEAGTGYFKTSWSGGDIKPAMGQIKVTKNDEGVAWGAVYWQYFEQLDKITPAETPLKLEKKLFVQRNTPTGPVIEPVTDQTVLKVGDKIKVRIELRVDRDMEYVHMKDMRASAFEPVNVISQYKYQDGLGYYENTRDAATNFFFNNLNKGTYVFEYPLFVTHKGDFSNGITTIQCMYAPEFTSHSEGIRVKIE